MHASTLRRKADRLGIHLVKRDDVCLVVDVGTNYVIAEGVTEDDVVEILVNSTSVESAVRGRCPHRSGSVRLYAGWISGFLLLEARCRARALPPSLADFLT